MQGREIGITKALVTGSTRGIGFSIAKELATHGIELCITGRNEEHLADAKDRIGSIAPGRVHAISLDLGDSSAPERLIAEAVDHLGGLDLVVNNAGITLSAPLQETTMEDWERIMAINARAPYFICKYALPHLKRSEAPTIVQISSTVGNDSYPLQSVYGASKHALEGFTKALAKEVHDDGIRIYTISPGGVETEMIGTVRPDIKQDELIKPQEIASLVWYLISHRSNAMLDRIALRRARKIPW